MTLLADLAPFLLGGLLGWTGIGKAFGRDVPRQAADSALPRILGDLGLGKAGTGGLGPSVLALRTLGFVELALAALLLATPTSTVPAVGTVLLGLGFLGYLAYAKVKAPGSSCGCTAGAAPIGWRAFARAGLVAAGGMVAAAASASWWDALAADPVAGLGVVLGAGAAAVALTADLDHLWLLPLRRLRLRLLGSPLADQAWPSGSASRSVPLAASVDLLQTSLAWRAAASLVRSGLVEYWDTDGWRILRYTGTYPGEAGSDAGPERDSDHDGEGVGTEGRPVSVLFAMSAEASTATTTNPIVRVTVLDEETQEALPDLVAV